MLPFASVAAAIIMVLGETSVQRNRCRSRCRYSTCSCWSFLDHDRPYHSVGLVHTADAAARKGIIKGVERAHFVALLLQGLRIAIPAALLLMIPAETVKTALEQMPKWLSDGMQIGGGMVVAVGLCHGYQHDGEP